MISIISATTTTTIENAIDNMERFIAGLEFDTRYWNTNLPFIPGALIDNYLSFEISAEMKRWIYDNKWFKNMKGKKGYGLIEVKFLPETRDGFICSDGTTTNWTPQVIMRKLGTEAKPHDDGYYIIYDPQKKEWNELKIRIPDVNPIIYGAVLFFLCQAKVYL